MSVIMASDNPLVIGERLAGMYDAECQWHAEQPFVVVGEATEADYFRQLDDLGVRHLFTSWERPMHYYRVAMD
jgi:hypothetical protein